MYSGSDTGYRKLLENRSSDQADPNIRSSIGSYTQGPEPAPGKVDDLFDYINRQSSGDQYRDLIGRISSGEYSNQDTKAMFV